MSDGIVFRSDIKVVLDPETHCGSDDGAARKARVYPPMTPIEGAARTLATCVKLKHNSPLEHQFMGVYCEMPGVVWWQLTRHRFMSMDAEDFSPSLESGRYRVLDGEFYVPPPERPCVEPDGFKPMRPHHVYGTAEMSQAEVHDFLSQEMRTAFNEAWYSYGLLIEKGIAREVARLVLPNWALYCDGYVSGRALTWLQLFMKRAKTPDTTVPTFPQYEIEQFTRACEEIFAGLWPETHKAFISAGRQAP